MTAIIIIIITTDTTIANSITVSTILVAWESASTAS